MATLPKPRHQPSRPGGAPLPFPAPAVNPKRPVAPSHPSLPGFQTQTPLEGLREPNSFAELNDHLFRVRHAAVALWLWWKAADFRTRQLPVLMVALMLWAATANMAWRSEESATPLLRQTMDNIRQARAHAAIAAPAAPASLTLGTPKPEPPVTLSPAPRAAAPSSASRAVASPSPRSDSLLSWKTVRDWLFPEPSTAEKVQGNPRRRVWVDMHTGLYYCPGADYFGYGGTRRGKIMSQKDAQYEYFQPATGAPCE